MNELRSIKQSCLRAVKISDDMAEKNKTQEREIRYLRSVVEDLFETVLLSNQDEQEEFYANILAMEGTWMESIKSALQEVHREILKYEADQQHCLSSHVGSTSVINDIGMTRKRRDSDFHKNSLPCIGSELIVSRRKQGFPPGDNLKQRAASAPLMRSYRDDDI